MNKRIHISFLFCALWIATVHAQWTEKDSINLQRILSGEQEIKLNPETIEKILLEIPIKQTPELLKPLLSTDNAILEFKEELPLFFTDSLEENSMYFFTLKPYNISTKYNEDPIYGGATSEYVWPMATKMYGRSQSLEDRLYYTSFQFVQRGAVVTNGGVGVAVYFSMEDVLQRLFSKKGRARLRNAKNANAWKTY